MQGCWAVWCSPAFQAGLAQGPKHEVMSCTSSPVQFCQLLRAWDHFKHVVPAALHPAVAAGLPLKPRKAYQLGCIGENSCFAKLQVRGSPTAAVRAEYGRFVLQRQGLKLGGTIPCEMLREVA